MARASDLEHSLLRVLLDRELEAFRKRLESEDPGLSRAELDRYMRAARMFAAQLLGARPRTRGRQLRRKRD